MTDFVLTEYVKSLMERIDEARILRHVQVSDGGWKPHANLCHQNVTEWCERHPEYSPVRGWLYFDMDNYPRAQFRLHSAVRASGGETLDITPSNASQDYPFIDACLSEEQFAELVQRIGSDPLWVSKN